MLTLGKVTADRREGVYRYFHGDHTAKHAAKGSRARKHQNRGDYYLDEKGTVAEAKTLWWGKGAAALGLEGKAVTGRAFGHLLDGEDPRVKRTRDAETGKLTYKPEQLVKAGGNGEHTLAIEAMFSPSKSVSILWAVGDTETRRTIQRAHDQAVRYALGHMESRLKPMRRAVDVELTDEKRDEHIAKLWDHFVHMLGREPDVEEAAMLAARKPRTWLYEETAGLTVAIFNHNTSRPTAACNCPDPQIHSHCLVMNAALRTTPDKAGRTWGAIDDITFRRARAEMGAVYRTHLAHTLQGQGYAINREGDYTHVAGISPKTMAAMSKRSQEVAHAAQAFEVEHGRAPTAIEAAQLALENRKNKTPLEDNIFAQWAEQLAPYGVTAKTPELLRALAARNPRTKRSADEVLALAVQSMGEQHGIFTWRTLTAAIAVEAQGHLAPDELDVLLMKADAASVAADPAALTPELHAAIGHLGQQVLTSQSQLDIEQRADGQLAQLRGGRRITPLTEGHLAVGARATGKTLSDEQLTALRTLAASPGLAVMEAPAGSGKTIAAEAYAAAWRAAHPTGRIICLATAGVRATELGQDIQAVLPEDKRIEGRTIEGFDRTRAKLSPNDLLIIDEAGQVEHARWAMILGRAVAGETQIVAVGDRAQLTSIEAGGMWRTWADRAERAGQLAVLAENRRAFDPQDARAWDDIRRGAGVEAAKHYHAKGQVIIAQSPEGAKDRAVAAWITDPRDAILVAENNRDLDALNRLAQTKRLEAHQALAKIQSGQSPADVAEAMGLDPDTLAAWVAAEAEQPGSVALDPTPVQTTRDGRVQLVPMASVTVTALDGPEYQRTETLRIGDRVECQRTTYVPALDGYGKAGADRRVSNGERGTIVGIHAPDRPVRPKDGQTEEQAKAVAALVVVSFGAKTVVFDPDHRDRLRLGYAVSAYKSQGRTVDRVHVVTGSWQGDQRNAYVEVSRARQASYVYADMSSLEVDHGSLTAEQDALTALAKRWQVFTPELTATEAVEVARGKAGEATAAPASERLLVDRPDAMLGPEAVREIGEVLGQTGLEMGEDAPEPALDAPKAPEAVQEPKIATPVPSRAAVEPEPQLSHIERERREATVRQNEVEVGRTMEQAA